MTRAVTAITAVAILAAAAVAHGLWTDRWGPSLDVQAAAARLNDLPTRVGDWDGEAVAFDPRVVEAAQVAGLVGRRYVHRYSGAGASVMLVCGRPGPVSVHTPDVCYSGAGYTPGPAQKRPVPGGGELWVADFTKAGPTPETLRISWGWTTGGDLIAADSPRAGFAREKVLYKVYLIRPVAAADAAAAPELDLLAALLPDLRKCVAPVL